MKTKHRVVTPLTSKIPVPDALKPLPKGASRYPLETMKVGDSFSVVFLTTDKEQAKNNILTIIRERVKILKEKKALPPTWDFVHERSAKEIRFWRVK